MNLAIIMLASVSMLAASSDGDRSVNAGREAMDGLVGSPYPWYDSGSDEIRRVEIPKPPVYNSAPNWNAGFGGSFSSNPLQWIAYIALLLLLVGLAYLLYRAFRDTKDNRLAGAEQTATTDEEDEIERVEALPFPVQRGKLDLLSQARQCYQQGNYAEAIVYLFSFQLVHLDRNQVIRLTKGKTNRQYLREVGSRRDLRGVLEQTMVAFEDVFFGNHPIEQSRFESCWSRLDEFQAMAQEGVGG